MSLMSFDEIPVLDQNVFYPIINGTQVKLHDFHPYTQYAIPFENGSLLIANTDAVAELGLDRIKMAIEENTNETPIEGSRMKNWLWDGLAYLDKGAPINQVGYGYGVLVRTPEGGFNGMLSKDFHVLAIRKEYDYVNGSRTFASYSSARSIRSTIANSPFKQEAYTHLVSKYSIPYNYNDEIIFKGPVLIYGFQIHHDYIREDGTVGMPRELQMECQTVGNYNQSKIKDNYNPPEIKPIHRTFLCD